MSEELQAYTWRDDLYYINTMVNGKIGHRREIVVSWLRFWLTYWLSPRNFERPVPNVLKEKDESS